jgi:hypothetical protein
VNFIQQAQQCKFNYRPNPLINFLFRNNQTFHTIFASSMKRDYGVSPLMIGAKPGFIWSYDDPKDIRIFSEAIPLMVSAEQCHNLTICLWYVSPLQSLNDSAGTQYALLGEWNKWTAVSQQRFTSIMTDTKKNEATITLEGASGETVPVIVFHSVLQSVIVNCSISAANPEAHVVITPSTVVCS